MGAVSKGSSGIYSFLSTKSPKTDRLLFCFCFLPLIETGIRKQNCQGEVLRFLFGGSLSRTVCNTQRGINLQMFHLRSPGRKVFNEFQNPGFVHVPCQEDAAVPRDKWGLQSHQHTSDDEWPQKQRTSGEAEDSGLWRPLQD